MVLAHFRGHPKQYIHQMTICERIIEAAMHPIWYFQFLVLPYSWHRNQLIKAAMKFNKHKTYEETAKWVDSFGNDVRYINGTIPRV